ncbi:MAG: radical SAM protein [Bacilli bacterium]|jgi:hypothetical protein|nr:radical SAM protein [Bacilli bacterium]
MRLYYSRLQIELTRRCNQKCAHCCRGESQNVDITEEIINDFFEKNDISNIGTLLFSGGEPTLNGKMLEYIVDKIIEKGIIVDMFILGINGLFYSEELVRGLNKLQDYIILKSNRPRTCVGLLMVSQDQFHKEADKEVIKKLKNLSYFSPIDKDDIKQENILPYGRAYENGLSIQQPDLSKLTNYQDNYRIQEYEGTNYLVVGYQYLSANGNIVNDGCQSYNLMDKYSLGNIQNQTVVEIYTGMQSKKLIKI